MKLLLLLLLALPAFAQISAQKKITGLEKRVTKIEKRVAALEKAGVARPADVAVAEAAAVSPDRPPAIPKNPIAVYLVKKRQFVSKEKMGVTLSLEFENLSRRRFYAFNGELVFKDENGALIWAAPYAYSDPIGPGERVKVELPVQGVQAKEYLKFVRSGEVNAAFVNQEFYAAD